MVSKKTPLYFHKLLKTTGPWLRIQSELLRFVWMEVLPGTTVPSGDRVASFAVKRTTWLTRYMLFDQLVQVFAIAIPHTGLHGNSGAPWNRHPRPIWNARRRSRCCDACSCKTRTRHTCKQNQTVNTRRSTSR